MGCPVKGCGEDHGAQVGHRLGVSRALGLHHSYAPDGPFSIPAHHSYRLGWSVLVLTQVPSLPALCLPQGELPQTDAEVPAGKPAEQREAGDSLSCPQQLLHPQLDAASGDLQRVPGVALAFPLGYTSSHQRKHLCSFCPQSSCWAHCRRAVISRGSSAQNTCFYRQRWAPVERTD